MDTSTLAALTISLVTLGAIALATLAALVLEGAGAEAGNATRVKPDQS